MKRTVSYYWFGLMVLALGLVLTACGNEVTPGPVNSTSVAATSPTTLAPTLPSSPAAAIPTTLPPTVAPTLPATPSIAVTTATVERKLPYLVVGNPSAGGGLRLPNDGAIDKDGNLYVADGYTYHVYKYDKSGQFLNFVGPDSTQSHLGQPEYLATDATSNLYITYANGRTIKYDPTGKSLGLFGDPELGGVESMVGDTTGNLYAITNQDYLVKYDQAGKVVNKLKANQKTGGKLASGQFDYNSKVRVDQSGNIYLFETFDPARLQKFKPDFSFTGSYQTVKDKDGKPVSLVDVVFDPAGNVVAASDGHLMKFDSSAKLVSDTPVELFNIRRLFWQPDGFLQVSAADNKTGKIDLTGKQLNVFGKPNYSEPGQFQEASSLALDEAGNFYVGDVFRAQIQKFNEKGQLLLTINEKTTGQLPDNAYVRPNYLAVDKSGNIYYTGNPNIVKLSSSGKFLGVFGKEGEADGELKSPSGLVLDKDGNLYVGETERGIIQKFSPQGKFLLKYSIKIKDSDTFAHLSMAFDTKGNLYVGRAYSKGIMVFGPDGQSKGLLHSTKDELAELIVQGLAIDPQDNLYALSVDPSKRIVIFDQAGQLKSSYGGEGYFTLEFIQPESIVVDASGNLYVAETLGARVQRWHPADTTLKAGVPITPGQ